MRKPGMNAGTMGRCRRATRGVRLVGAVVLASAVGCQSSETREGGKRIVARPVPYIADVPLPSNFKMVDRMTDDYISGDVRFVRHVYEGRCDRAALRGFYQEQMPAYRWSRVTDQNVQGEITMRFEKGNEMCVVVIRPARGGLGDKTVIRVTIQPFDRNGRQPPARPAS
jgi:hypothetical protein